MKNYAKTFELKFLRHCRKKKFFSRNDRVLLAVSGGMDSMAMSHLFGALQSEFRIGLGIAHLNHDLRGSHSDRDEIFVKKFAQLHGYSFHCKKVDVRRRAKASKTSIEEEARNSRYGYLEKIARQYGYNKICTAHHSADQAETVLMRIVKGAGISGLSGIHEARGLLIRPLLFFSKKEIETYVKQKKINYVEDHTNHDTAYLRNRIRHQLMPLLKKEFDPQSEKHLIQLGLIAGDIRIFFKKQAKRLFRRVCSISHNKIVLEIKTFNRYLRSQRHAIIEFLLEEYFDVKLKYHDYQKLFDLIDTRPSGKKLLFGDVICLKALDCIIFSGKHQLQHTDFCFQIETGRTYNWEQPFLSFSSTAFPMNAVIKKQFGRSREVEYIDLDKIKGSLILRNWKNGDCFRPLGMNGLKKLSDFFIDQKILLTKKKQIPILCEKIKTKEKIVWVCGQRLDDRYKVESSTHHILKLECKRNEKDH